ncbi:MAG: glycosyl hydrolase family 8 [Frankiaceae bacterium]
MTALFTGVLVLTGCAGSHSTADRNARARDAVQHFLRDYMQPDGRVVRFDQGNDTVSEAQSYAMLLAVAADDRDEFDRAWRWAANNLQRPDGLLDWHWAHGIVVDPVPASDADLLSAWALDVAARRFARPDYEQDSQHIRDGILAAETVQDTSGEVIVAGPWATTSGTVNPSYWTPAAVDRFASEDPRWGPVAATLPDLIDAATQHGRQLPSDWASSAADPTTVRLTGTASPSGTGGVVYGYDAARLLVWTAASCQPAMQARAAALGPLVGTDPNQAGIIPRQIDGTPASTDHQPLALVAAAAAAGAHGDPSTRDRLLDAADRLAHDQPGYYAEAWAALGHVLLQTSLLSDCAR